MKWLLAALFGLLVSPAVAQGTFPGLDARFFGNKTFVGDAVNNPNVFTASGNIYGATCSTGDWFANFEATTSNLSCGYWPGFALVAESKTNTIAFPNLNPSGGILGAGQTLNNNFGGAFGVAGFGLGNNINAGTTGPAGAAGAWGGYFESDCTAGATHASCFGAEIEVGNFVSDAYSAVSGNFPDPFAQSHVNSAQVGCGSGLATPTPFKCSAAVQIVDVGGQFRVGLNILNGSIATQTIFGGSISIGIAMPTAYGVAWYSAANTVAGGFYFDGSGNFTLAATDIVINGNAGVSCSVSPPANLTVVHGVVTLCN